MDDATDVKFVLEQAVSTRTVGTQRGRAPAMTARPGLICAGRWDAVQEACEVDMISTALLLARWRRLIDGRAEANAVEDRILRRAIELRDGRGYIAALNARRQHRFVSQYAQAANDAATLAPWLDQDAA